MFFMNSNFEAEQQRLTNVMKIISEEINRLEDETSRRKNEVIQIRKHFWDEVKVNTDTFDDYLETIIGLRQEVQALSVSQGTHRHASKRLSTLQRMQDVPYFGRIDFWKKILQYQNKFISEFLLFGMLAEKTFSSMIGELRCQVFIMIINPVQLSTRLQVG